MARYLYRLARRREQPRLVRPGVFAMALFVFPLDGCSCYLVEYDRMEGTAFPRTQQVAEQAVSLSFVSTGVIIALSLLGGVVYAVRKR